MSLLDTLLEAALYLELQEHRHKAEEEPKSPVSLRVTGVSVTRGNSVLRPATPPIAPAAIPVSVLVTAPPPHLPPLPPLEPAPAPAPVVPLPVPALVPVSHHPAPIDFIQEHSRPRNTNGHGCIDG